MLTYKALALLQVTEVLAFVLAAFKQCKGTLAPDDPTATSAGRSDTQDAWLLVDAASLLAANLCTDAETAPPLARSVPLADLVLDIAAACSLAVHPSIAVSLGSFLANVTSFNSVSALPSPLCPEAGGNAFLEASSERLLPFLVQLLQCGAPGAAEAASKALAHIVRIPDAAEAACTGPALPALITALSASACKHSSSETTMKTASALHNLAQFQDGRTHMQQAGAGSAVACALRRTLSQMRRSQKCDHDLGKAVQNGSAAGKSAEAAEALLRVLLVLATDRKTDKVCSNGQQLSPCEAAAACSSAALSSDATDNDGQDVHVSGGTEQTSVMETSLQHEVGMLLVEMTAFQESMPVERGEVLHGLIAQASPQLASVWGAP